MVVLFHLLANK